MSNRKILYFRIETESICAMQGLTAQPSIEDPWQSIKYKYTSIILFAFYRYSEADTLYNQTRALADKARERAKEAYKVALKLYTEATSIQLPVFDLDVLDGNTERIKTSVSKEKLGLGDGGSVSVSGFPIENSTTDLSLCCLFSTF